MDFDDVVIGSGMSALGAVLGLDPKRRVLVLGGNPRGEYSYYDSRQTVPCAFSGVGGLGNDWHGVIPTGLRENFGACAHSDFADTFGSFYPHTDVRPRLGEPWLFVPWRAIRPAQKLAEIALAREGRLVFLPQAAVGFCQKGRGVEVSTSDSVFRSRRAWLAAGALHTPALLERSLGVKLGRGFVSDHALCYVGQVEGAPPLKIKRSRDGMFVPAEYGRNGIGLYTRRPARFEFKNLDSGIEQRAVFGLPTGNAVKKILRRMSPGLLAEAFYNRFGVFAAARTYSVYSQVLVRDAYVLADGKAPLSARAETIRAATDSARENQPFQGLTASRRPDMYIPGIHLHHSLDLDLLANAGINVPDAAIQVVDASVLTDIGPDHHTFKLLLAAMARTRRTSQ